MPSDNIRPLILIDTREPDPHPWESHFTVGTCRATLPTGDLSLAGCGDLICIERKTLDDLISCLCAGRHRFSRELQRAQRIRQFYLICEGSYHDLLKGQYHSKMHPRAAWESEIALQSRYGIPFLFAGNEEMAARLGESILLRWFKEHINAIEAATKGARAVTATRKVAMR